VRVITGLRDIQATTDAIRVVGQRIGVVPTMGYLHEGHISLVQKARERSDVVIMTLFVNPTQFAPTEDLETYPRDFENDCAKAEAAGVNLLFAPTPREMYPPEFSIVVEPGILGSDLEGIVRPTHFLGVLTVVAKLFHLTRPHVAVFGQKDFQQAMLIRKMVRDLDFDVEVLVAPIVRESDGLAMSSRNVFLSPDERSRAIGLSRGLHAGAARIAGGERNVSSVKAAIHRELPAGDDINVDYVRIADPEFLQPLEMLTSGTSVVMLLAVRVGKTRLIDNMVVPVPQ
jgi:pantoate--beta-alanine ligase